MTNQTPKRSPQGWIVRSLVLSLLSATSMTADDRQSADRLPLETSTDAWIVEQMPGGGVTMRDGEMEIRDVGGCTVWYRRELKAPVEIRYEAMVVEAGETGDRLSDLNVFWMATDPGHPEDLFFEGHQRTGAFATYDSLRTYYVGYGGNTNSTTRFRRYTGDGKRPLLPEHDLAEARFLLKPNHWYSIKLTAREGVASYERDGEIIFRYEDPEFLDRGWFGIRTVSSHLRLRNFRVSEPKKSSAGAEK